jgi:hypothetical protein
MMEMTTSSSTSVTPRARSIETPCNERDRGCCSEALMEKRIGRPTALRQASAEQIAPLGAWGSEDATLEPPSASPARGPPAGGTTAARVATSTACACGQGSFRGSRSHR